MNNRTRYVAQAAFYAVFFLPLAWLTTAPIYQYLAPDTAVLKLAVRHAGKVVGQCTTLSSQDYADLPANMKRPEVCPRERSDLRLELRLDGETIYRETVPASGLHNDGVSSMYRRFEVPAGNHRLQLFMNDDAAQADYNWNLEQDIELAPAQVVVASFREGFLLQ